MALLKLEDVGVVIGGVRLLDGIGFSIGKGQRVGLIGEAGAGKSLLLRAIAGLLPRGAAVTGGMSFDDQPMPVERSRLRGRHIGVLLQDAGAGLDPLLPVGAQLAEALAYAQMNEPAARSAALLEALGLDPELPARLPGELTASERQRVAVAMAIAGEPDLLILDDPTAGLDLLAQRRVLDLIERHVRERGLSLLMASPDLKAIALLSTKIVVLRGGRIIEVGEKPDVFGHPRHEFTRALLASGRHRARTLMHTPIGGTLLEARGLAKRYRRPDRSIVEPRPPLVALDDVSFSLRGGESMAVIGPAGSGKSTLARIVTGLERASAGELELAGVIYHGSDLPRLVRREVGYVARDPAPGFDPELTVGESIAEPLQLEMQKSMDELGARIVEVVTAVGLTADALGAQPHEFTTAELQRLAIARALVTRPRLMVLDEPVAALDIAARGEVLALLNRLRSDFGLSLLLVAHDLDALRAADRVLVLDKGRVIETGTPAQLVQSAQHPLTRALVAAQLPDVGIVPVF